MAYHLATNMSSQDFGVDVARGVFENISPVDLFGFNRTIGTAYETVWNNGGGIYPFPTAASVVSVVSSSASDTMSVRLTGLDANRDILIEDVTLTGTDAVTTTGSFLRINAAQILSGKNVGNITVSHGSDVIGYIQAEYGTHQAAVYSVPRKHKLLIHQIDFTSGTLNENKHLFSRACLKPDPEIHFFETTFITSQLSYDLRKPFVVPSGVDFSIEAKSSAQENELTVYIGASLIREA
jgi:hypothetical protein